MSTAFGKVQVYIAPAGSAAPYSKEFHCLNAAKVFAESVEIEARMYGDIEIFQTQYSKNVLTGDVFTSTRIYYVEDSTDRCEFHSDPNNGEACNLITLREQERRLAESHFAAL